MLATPSFPETAQFSQAPLLATGEVRPGEPLPGGLRCSPEATLPEFTLDPLTSSPGRRPSGARLYHRGSVFAEPARLRMDRAHAWRLMASAEALERDTRVPGQARRLSEAHRPRRAPRAAAALLQLPRRDLLPELRGDRPRRRVLRRDGAESNSPAGGRRHHLDAAPQGRRPASPAACTGSGSTVAVQTSNSYTFNAPGSSSITQLAPAPQPKPRQTAAFEADAKFRRETSIPLTIEPQPV